MARGRRKKPEAVKDATGVRTKRKAIPKPSLPAGVPEPPRHLETGRLGKRSVELWELYAPELYRLGLLTRLDVEMFGLWCWLKALLDDCRAQLMENGLTVPTRTGGAQKSPAAQMVLSLSAELRHLGTEFGMSPRARGSLDIRPPEPPKGDDEFSKYLRKRQEAVTR